VERWYINLGHGTRETGDVTTDLRMPLLVAGLFGVELPFVSR